MRLAVTKNISALISLLSVLIAALSSVFVFVDSLRASLQVYLMLIAVLSSMVAGLMALFVTRKIRVAKKSKNIFIICSKDDYDSAMYVTEVLRAAGFKPWNPIDNIVPGQEIKASVSKALEESNAAVVILSNNFHKSDWAKFELGLAMKILRPSSGGAIPIIPVCIDNSGMPQQLEDIQSVNISDEDWVERFVSGISYATGLSI